MLRLQRVAVHKVVAFVVAGMDIDLLAAGDKAQRKLHIGAELLRRLGPAGIVAGHLNAAGQVAVGIFKARDIVPLPAVHGDGGFVADADSFLHIHAILGIVSLGQLETCVEIVHDSSAPYHKF